MVTKGFRYTLTWGLRPFVSQVDRILILEVRPLERRGGSILLHQYYYVTTDFVMTLVFLLSIAG